MTRYATTTNLVRLGIRAEALSGVATAVQEEALDAASAVADGYLRARGYVLPITAWSADLTRAVAILAAFDLLVTRGFEPSHSRLGGFRRGVRWLGIAVFRERQRPIIYPMPGPPIANQQRTMDKAAAPSAGRHGRRRLALLGRAGQLSPPLRGRQAPA